MLTTILTRPDGGAGLAGEAAADGDASAAAPPPPSAPRFTVGGWVRAGREAGAGAFAFVELADGTCPGTLQVVVPAGVAESVGGLKAVTPSGTSLLITGALLRCPPGTRQAVELKAETITYVGACDNGKGGYPLAGKKRHTPEFLREVAHLRPRTALIGAVARVRSALAAATHAFFRGEGFQYVMTPIITAADCEGAGEMFQVTTLLTQADADAAAGEAPTADARASLRAAADAAAEVVKHVKAGKAAQPEVAAAVEAMLSARAAADAADERAARVGGLPRGAGGVIDYSRDFFGKAAYLTVSGQVREKRGCWNREVACFCVCGSVKNQHSPSPTPPTQLNAEYYALGLSAVYTFGPTFRAENSHTGRHLAEFWMIEPEVAFASLTDDMALAEAYIKAVVGCVLKECEGELEVLDKAAAAATAAAAKGAAPKKGEAAAAPSPPPTTLKQRLTAIVATPFVRLSYTDAVAVLEAEISAKKVKFEFPVSWGVDLAAEHERYLTDVLHAGTPVIVYDYPKEIKAFYMRANDDGKTVAAMDVLVPGVGELVGGSQREERLDVLEARILETGMPLAAYSSYLDTRKFGTVPHAGFGVGFERLVQFVTGMDNIRDVIPFPRWPGHAEF